MKDLRKDFNYEDSKIELSDRHLNKFESKLNRNFKNKKDFSTYYKVASVVVILLLSSIILHYYTTSSEVITEETPMKLGDISPELQQLENFYLTSINYELATLETDHNFDEVVDDYLEELKIIDSEYQDLQDELNENGVNENLIDAMLKNLQLRLELLQNLKSQLNDLKTLNNENNSYYQI
ncbi:hypothetical protein [Psychroflexus aestuariivivens]|uniref:hypothetical protein n=1 Tax=Psychroflexus aestuariivivens TaxID=1795040 RepID=UPI000FD9C644|nr:hypothetical protein [Psychroflexus aestuariivivens]